MNSIVVSFCCLTLLSLYQNLLLSPKYTAIFSISLLKKTYKFTTFTYKKTYNYYIVSNMSIRIVMYLGENNGFGREQ